MRIVFFGSSHGVPEPNRRCSSTLIELGDNRYFIDMGTQSIEQLATRKIPVDSVKAIFITHMHGDHTDGLISFVDLCNWYYKSADPEIFLPEPVEATVDALRGWLKCNGHDMKDYRFSPVKTGVIFDDGIIKVTAFKTKHTAYSWAYLVEGEGKRVLFSGDLCGKGPGEDFPVDVLNEPADLAICEVAHFPATAYLPIFKGCAKLKQICFNHYSDTFLSSILEMQNCLLPEKRIFRAEDGMEINL